MQVYTRYMDNKIHPLLDIAKQKWDIFSIDVFINF